MAITWEIGLIKPDMTEPAVQIVGPFTTMEDAHKAMDHYNATAKLPGLCWLWARTGEMSRIEGCLTSEPNL